MSYEKKQATPPKRSRPRAKREASDILRSEVNELLELMDRVKALSQDKDSFKDLLDLLEGVGRASTRLATLLKAEKELTANQNKSQALIKAATRLMEARERQASLEKGDEKGANG